MTKEMTNETVKYLITLKIEQVEELRKAMESAGIPFDLTEDMIGMPTDNIMEDIYMGKDAEYLADKVNEYLEEQGKPERITQPFEEMDIRAQRDLLLLGSIHSDWAASTPTGGRNSSRRSAPKNGRNFRRGTQRPYQSKKGKRTEYPTGLRHPSWPADGSTNERRLAVH